MDVLPICRQKHCSLPVTPRLIVRECAHTELPKLKNSCVMCLSATATSGQLKVTCKQPPAPCRAPPCNAFSRRQTMSSFLAAPLLLGSAGTAAADPVAGGFGENCPTCESRATAPLLLYQTISSPATPDRSWITCYDHDAQVWDQLMALLAAVLV